MLWLSLALAEPVAPLLLEGRHAVDANGDPVPWDEVADLARVEDPEQVEAIEERFKMQNVLMGAWAVELGATGALVAADKDQGAMIVGIVALTHGVSVVAILASGVRGKDRQTLLGLANRALEPEDDAGTVVVTEAGRAPEAAQPGVPDLPVGLMRHSLFGDPNGLVLTGGYTTDSTFDAPQPDTWRLVDGEWTPIQFTPAATIRPELPDDRTDAGWRHTPDGWVVVGGLQVEDGQIPAPSAEALVFKDGVWTRCPADPLAARQDAALAWLPDGRVAALGGERVVEGAGMAGFNPPRAVAETAILDPSTCTWTAGPPLQRPRSGAAAAWTEDGVVVTGGAAFAEQPTRSVEIWTP